MNKREPSGTMPRVARGAAVALALLLALIAVLLACRRPAPEELGAPVAVADQVARAHARRGAELAAAGKGELARRELLLALHHAESLDLIREALPQLARVERTLGHVDVAEDLNARAARWASFAVTDSGQCLAARGRRFTSGGPMQDWRAVLRAIAKRYEQQEGKPYPISLAELPDERRIREHLRVASIPGPTWVVEMARAVDSKKWHVVGQRRDGTLALYLDIAETMPGRCTGGVQEVPVAPWIRPLVTVRDEGAVPGAIACFDAAGQQVPCDSAEVAGTMSSCGEGSIVSIEHFVFDFEQPNEYLLLTEPGSSGEEDEPLVPLELIAQERGVRVVGEACDEFVAIDLQ